MKRLRLQLLTFIRSKRINVFLVFLLLSFGILIVSKLSRNYTHTILFKIERTKVPETKTILSQSDSTLHVTLRTHGFRWLKYYFDEPVIRIDFSRDVSLRAGKFICTNPKSALFRSEQLTKQAEIINTSPDTLFFYYDSNAVKKVPVVLDAHIKFASGFDSFSPFELTPDSVKIIGPKQLINRINTLETKPFKRNAVTKDIHEKIALQLPKVQENLKFSHSHITLDAKVERFTEGRIQVPIDLINVPEGTRIKYFPKALTVRFYTSLSRFKNIHPNDFRIVCDYSKVGDQQSFLTPEFSKIAPTVKSAKINNRQIEFVILK